MIELDRIRIDGGTQARDAIVWAVVEEYAQAYRDGVQMPPIMLFYDKQHWWLADGFHRYHAALQAGLSKTNEDITPGTQRDAILHSLSANATHGLQRTDADKRHAVLRMLEDPEWGTWSDREIARRCVVHPTTVARVRADVAAFINGEPEQPSGKYSPGRAAVFNSVSVLKIPTVHVDSEKRSYTTKHGSAAVMETSKIGRSAATAPPAPVLKTPEEPPPPAAAPPSAAALADFVIEKASSAGPASAGTAPAAGPAAHVAELETQVAVLTAQLAELAAMLEETLADNTTMAKVFEADDQLQAATAEVKRLNAEVAVLRSRIDGLMNEKNEAIRAAKAAQRKVERLEKAAKS